MDVPTFFSIRNTHTDRQTDIQTDRHTYIQTHIEFYIYRYIYIYINDLDCGLINKLAKLADDTKIGNRIDRKEYIINI